MDATLGAGTSCLGHREPAPTERVAMFSLWTIELTTGVLLERDVDALQEQRLFNPQTSGDHIKRNQRGRDGPDGQQHRR